MASPRNTRKRVQEDTTDFDDCEKQHSKCNEPCKSTDVLSLSTPHNPKKIMHKSPPTDSRLHIVEPQPLSFNMLPVLSHSTPCVPRTGINKNYEHPMSQLLENTFDDSTVYMNSNATKLPQSTMLLPFNELSKCSFISNYANPRTPLSVSCSSFNDTALPPNFSVMRFLNMPSYRFRSPSFTSDSVLEVNLEKLCGLNSIIKIRCLENWFTNHTGLTNLTYETLFQLVELNVEFFTYVSKKLAAYRKENNKDVLDHRDVGEVMRNVLKISPSISFNSLIHQYLPMELWFNYDEP